MADTFTDNIQIYKKKSLFLYLGNKETLKRYF